MGVGFGFVMWLWWVQIWDVGGGCFSLFLSILILFPLFYLFRQNPFAYCLIICWLRLGFFFFFLVMGFGFVVVLKIMGSRFVDGVGTFWFCWVLLGFAVASSSQISLCWVLFNKGYYRSSLHIWVKSWVVRASPIASINTKS